MSAGDRLGEKGHGASRGLGCEGQQKESGARNMVSRFPFLKKKGPQRPAGRWQWLGQVTH